MKTAESPIPYLYLFNVFQKLGEHLTTLHIPSYTPALNTHTRLYVLSRQYNNYDLILNQPNCMDTNNCSLFYNAEPKHNFCFPIWLLVQTY